MQLYQGLSTWKQIIQRSASSQYPESSIRASAVSCQLFPFTPRSSSSLLALLNPEGLFNRGERPSWFSNLKSE